MDESKIIELCRACDYYLKSSLSNPVRIANAWLHFIRPHPEILKKYSYYSNANLGSLIRIFLRNVGYFLWNMGKSLIERQADIRSAANMEVDIVLVSHLLDRTHLRRKEDFYFGKLGVQLASHGVRSLTVLIDHTKGSLGSGKAADEADSCTRLVLPRVCSLGQEISIFFCLLWDGWVLNREASRNTDPFLKDIGLRGSVEATSPESIKALRLGKLVSLIAESTRCRFVITTYEGHAWERSVFANVRSQNPEVSCVGYQHAAIFKRQHGIFRRLAPAFQPDFVCTAGRVSRAVFIESGVYAEKNVLLLGSNRRGEVNLTTHVKLEKAVCLVLPEGFLSECELLFKLALSCSKLSPDTLFVWRTHPNMGFEILFEKLPILQEAKFRDNIILSTNTLYQDIISSRWALYRGSTSIVQACAAGVIPIYLSIEGEVSIDPLYSMKNRINYVADVSDLINVLAKANPDAANDELRFYCDNVFTELDCSQLVSVVNSPPQY